jgi:hypothetical protein
MLRRDPDVRGDQPQRDLRLERGVLGAESQVTRLGVEREQLVLARRLGQVQPLGDPRDHVRPRGALVGDRAQPLPREHDDAGRGLGDDRRSRRRREQQIAERADVVARPGEPARHLAAVGEQEVFADEAGQDRAALDGEVPGLEK